VVRYDGLRFHAEGGLGDVFLAHGGDLNRDVALKFLKQRRADDPDSRRRFLLEAEVTGRLEHPGVVPVYGLGTDEHGHSCYAMRFIRGQTLGEAIGRLHDGAGDGALEFRGLLRRFVAVCNTVAYAHSRGILHRDLKPRNVMLGPFDETLVVDWGLARPVGGLDPGADALTPTSGASGSGSPTAGVIGTPGYMSPEQAEGRHAEVGPASDVYSLGATLYCLLTGSPPFQGPYVGDMLRKVRRGDFPTPRQVRRGVPRALEAVCLKAMALKPDDRYPSALDLAAEIERWLADEPVSAWREPPWTRAYRWARRHKTLMTAAAALLVTAVVALAVGAAAIAREQRKTAGERDRADAHLRQARAAVDRYFVQVSESRLLNEPGLQPLRRELLESARDYYQQIADERATDPAALADLGMAYGRLAQITAEIETPAKAIELNRKARDVLTALGAAHPDEPRHRPLLAACDFVQGEFEQALGRTADAEASYRKALAAREALARERPGDAALAGKLAETHSRLGTLSYAAGRMKDAEEAFGRSRTLFGDLARDHPGEPRFRRGAASGLFNLALVLRETGRSREARDSFDAALRLREALVKESPGDIQTRRDLVFSHGELALLLFRDLHEPKEAEASYLRGLELARELARDNPKVTAYRGDLAKVLNNLGIFYQQTDHADEAVKAHEEALGIRRALSATMPDVPAYRDELAASLGNLSQLYRGRGDAARATEAERESIEIFEGLVRAHPDVFDYAQHLGVSYLSLGLGRGQRGDWRGAADAFDRAIRTFEGVLTRVPAHPFARSMTAHSLWGRGDVRSHLGRHADALDDLARAAGLVTEPVPLRESLKLCRALVLARRGDHAGATAEAAKVDPKPLTEGNPTGRANYLGDLARLSALCARAAAGDAALSQAEREEASERFASRAVGLLRESDEAGLFRDRTAVDWFFATSDDFSSLARRDDYRKFVAELENRRRK
jgi:serine/threonine-protein kinase